MELKPTIVELFPEQGQIGTLTVGIHEAIEKSLDTHPLRNITGRAIKERFERCIHWAEILRGDLGWGTKRIANALPDMLAAELSGQKWEPGTRQFWVTEDGS